MKCFTFLLFIASRLTVLALANVDNDNCRTLGTCQAVEDEHAVPSSPELLDVDNGIALNSLELRDVDNDMASNSLELDDISQRIWEGEGSNRNHNSERKWKIIRFKLGTYRQRPDQRSFDMKIGETAYVYANSYLRIRCPVRKDFPGDKQKNIRWLKDGQQLPTQRRRGHFRLTRHGALKIRRIREMDQGLYTCIANNSDSADSRVFVLRRLQPTLHGGMLPPTSNSKKNSADYGARRSNSRENTADNVPRRSNSGQVSLEKMPRRLNSSGRRWQLTRDKSWTPAPPAAMPYYPPPHYYDGQFYTVEDENLDQRPRDTVFAIIRPRPIIIQSNINTTPPSISTSYTTNERDLILIDELRAELERSWSRTLPAVDTHHARLILTRANKTDDNANDNLIQMIFDQFGNKVTFEWRQGSWSECNATCNNSTRGYQTRPVYCLASQSGNVRAVQVVNTSLCTSAGLTLQTATPERTCEMPANSCPKWKVNSWTNCLPTRCFKLHTSKRERRVYCAYDNGTQAEEEACANVTSHSLPPATIETCTLDTCVPEWIAMPWTPCSKTCGRASYRARNIKCVWKSSPEVYAGDLCPQQDEPPTTQQCEALPACLENNDDSLCKDVSNFCGLAANLNLCTLHEYHVKCCKSCELHQQTLIINGARRKSAAAGEAIQDLHQFFTNYVPNTEIQRLR